MYKRPRACLIPGICSFWLIFTVLKLQVQNERRRGTLEEKLALAFVLRVFIHGFSLLHRSPIMSKTAHSPQSCPASPFSPSPLPWVSWRESELISQELGPRDSSQTYRIWQLAGNQWGVLSETSGWSEPVWAWFSLSRCPRPLGSTLDFEALRFLFKTSLSDGNILLLKRRKALSLSSRHHNASRLYPGAQHPWGHPLR